MIYSYFFIISNMIKTALSGKKGKVQGMTQKKTPGTSGLSLDGSEGTHSRPGPCLPERASTSRKEAEKKGEIYNTLDHLSGIKDVSIFFGF